MKDKSGAAKLSHEHYIGENLINLLKRLKNKMVISQYLKQWNMN